MPRTILLADDSVTIRKVVELTFLDAGVRVVAVASGREALDLVGELRPDLVLADVVMPGPSGYEICRAVKASPRPVPVLLLAGTFEPFDPAEARACGADGHLTKPFDSRTLVDRVEALLGGAQAPPHAPEAPAPGPGGRDEELEAIFDDLAAPAGPEAADRPPAPVPAEVEAEREATPAPAPGPVPDAAPGGPAPPAPPAAAGGLTEGDIDAIAAAVVARLSERVLREIAWDVVPDLAEVIVRERLAELEREP